jgi:hypothetical protein
LITKETITSKNFEIMLKKITLFTACIMLTLTFSGCETLQGVLGTALNGTTDNLTNDQVAGGLKDALKQGVTKGVNTLSARDGFFKNMAVKILFPPEAQKVEQKLRALGFNGMVDNAIEKLNRAAEDAAVGAKDIFVDAIVGMTISDAMNILMGEKNACSNYLKKTTSTALYQKMNPVIKNSLSKVGALTAWNEVVTRYNQIPLIEKVNPNLDDHVTKKAIDGVFMMVEKEEGEIRKNPLSRGTELMKKVFAKQDK